MYLQLKVPDARILYSSATGASEPRNLAYMTRLGMWGFNETQEMIELLDRSKLVALELAAMSLKATGELCRRVFTSFYTILCVIKCKKQRLNAFVVVRYRAQEPTLRARCRMKAPSSVWQGQRWILYSG